MTTRRHDERYKRAIARITPARELEVRARVLKLPGLTLAAVEKLVAHKLGKRVEAK